MLLFSIHFNLLLERIYSGKKKRFIVLLPQRVKVCKFLSHSYHKISIPWMITGSVLEIQWYGLQREERQLRLKENSSL